MPTKKPSSKKAQSKQKVTDDHEESETTTQSVDTPSTSTVWSIALIIISVATLSLATYTAPQILSPLYGGTASYLHFTKIIVATVLVSVLLPAAVKPGSALLLSGVFLCISPACMYWVGVWTSRQRIPLYGAVVTYAIGYVPIVYFSCNIFRHALLSVLPNKIALRAPHHILTGIGICSLIFLGEAVWIPFLPKGLRLSPSPALVALGLLHVLLSSLHDASTTTNSDDEASTPTTTRTTFISQSLALLLILVSTNQPPIRALHVPATHPSGLLRTLSTTASVTGQIVVAENLEHGFRYMRADHSLLGGVWVGEKAVAMDNMPVARDLEDAALGDSIYGTFILQEAVRLQKREPEHKQENALVIGLGAGIAAEAFKKHGLHTTLVEIDPAVYDAARRFFGLQKPNAVYLEDARGWVAQQSSLGNQTFDIIVHDCFSGGGVPQHIFTREFFSDSKKILASDGIIAVNYAGVPNGPSTKAILATLEDTFGSCRAFHDYAVNRSQKDFYDEFINIVFFCTPSSTLDFRKADHEDYLHSYLREHMLSNIHERELNLAPIRGDSEYENVSQWVLTDERNPLGIWQREGALAHWQIMRDLLPDYVWETY